MGADGLVFIHIMKTGGGSLNDRMTKGFGYRRAFPRYLFAPFEVTMSQKMSVSGYIELGAERTDYPFHTLHMPAAVATLVPEYLSLTVLRDPVARAVSHLRQLQTSVGAGQFGLDELYDQFGIRAALRNYQTRVLAADLTEIEEFSEDPDPPVREAEAVPPELMVYLGTSGIPSIDESDALARATECLLAFDIVGTTATLAAVQRRVEQQFGWDERPVGHEKRTVGEPDVSAWLLGELAADNQLDIELYEVAKTREAELFL